MSMKMGNEKKGCEHCSKSNIKLPLILRVNEKHGIKMNKQSCRILGNNSGHTDHLKLAHRLISYTRMSLVPPSLHSSINHHENESVYLLSPRPEEKIR